MISDVKIDPGSLLEVTTPLKSRPLYAPSCDRDGRSVVTRQYVSLPAVSGFPSRSH